MSPKLIAGGLVVLALAMVGLAQLTGGDGGGMLALGETAVVGYTQATSSGAPGPRTTLAVTVTAVRRGTQEELTGGGLGIDAEDRNATPYYVAVRFENRGETPVERNIGVILEDADGGSLPRALIFGTGGERFQPCPNVTEGTLAPGESYETCMLVLVPEGRNVDKALFVSQKPNNEIVFTRWSVSAS